MKIRNKILIYFSSTVIVLSAISLCVIYILFAEYREEEFQQRQKAKVLHTIKLWNEYKEMSENLSEIMDRLAINDFYDEKMLIFDKQKDLIYSSVDDLLISNYKELLHELSTSNRWLETKEGHYDIIGVYVEMLQSHFYAISKAYDHFGYTKLFFLRNTLIGIFVIISTLVVLVSLFLSKRISDPIVKLSEKTLRFKVGEDTDDTPLETNTLELNILDNRFSQLLKRTNEAFIFQKYAIQHISHELKTPLAILVSELEKIQSNVNQEDIKIQLQDQVGRAKSLGDIINALLEISKMESGQTVAKELVRIDDLIFDLIGELNMYRPDFSFEINYFPELIDESKLRMNVNPMLIRQAFMNILTNSINYSDNAMAQVLINCSLPHDLVVRFSNTGQGVGAEEERFLFDHFFRGNNSRGKSGFGLGLVLTKRILELHNGSIRYSRAGDKANIFDVHLPLR